MSETRKPAIPEIFLSIGLLVLTTILTYGALIPKLGFYRDDWYFLWTAQAQGAQGIVALFSIDRPLVGWIYLLDSMILPASPLAWHIFALLLRLLGVLGFFWLARLLWPAKRAETTLMALLFALYPGYLQQGNAATFSNLLIAVAAMLFSFAFTVKALTAKSRGGQVLYTLLSALLVLLYLGIFESMIGLEAARLVIIWMLRAEKDSSAWRPHLKRTLLAAVPYVTIALVFLYWRLFLFESTRRSTNLDVLIGRYTAIPWRAPLSILLENIKDVIETAVFAWAVPFYQFVSRGNYRDLAYSLALALIVVGLAFLYFRNLQNETDAEAQPGHIRYLWLGALILFAALLPINAAGRNVHFSDQWDRYTLHAAFGAALLVTGFLFHALRGVTRWIVLLALLGMSVVTQYHASAFYRDFWSKTRDLWWQMTWRAPAIQPQTMLIVIAPGAPFAEGYEVYGPANMIYYPGEDIKIGADVLNAGTLTKIIRQDPRSHYDRSVLVEDHYENTLIAVFPTGKSCLHVLDGKMIELAGYMDNSLIVHAAPYSRIDRVDPNAESTVPPAGIFGEEAARGWCYYYQKINLARQKGDWQEAARLADEAIGRDLTPNDVSEWLPILEAYAAIGATKEAKHAASIIRSDDNARQFLCSQINNRESVYPPPYDFESVREFLCGSR